MTKSNGRGNWRAGTKAIRDKRDRDGRIEKGKLLITPDAPPPHDDAAERAALGCVLLSSQSQPDVDELLSQMTAGLFYDLRHATILEAMKELRGAKRGLDIHTLIGWLKKEKKIEGAGGAPYVSDLPDAAPSQFNFPNYLPILREKSLRRWSAWKADELAMLAKGESISLEDVTARLADMFSMRISGKAS